MLISRGCINRCSFCNEYTDWIRYQFRDPTIVVEELAYQKSIHPTITAFWLSCSNLAGNIPKLKQFCELLTQKNLHISWDSQLSISTALNPDLLKLMKSSGCNFLHYGLESASNKVLKLMNKGYNRKTADRIIQDTIRCGIKFNFNIVVGFPGESNYNFIETLFFIKKILKYGISNSTAICYISPGSVLFHHFEKFKIIDYEQEFWRTKDSWNTLHVRKARQYFTKKLYQSKLLNPTLIKQSKFRNSKVAFKFFDLLSYLLFSLWLVWVICSLLIISVYNKAKFSLKNSTSD